MHDFVKHTQTVRLVLARVRRVTSVLFGADKPLPNKTLSFSEKFSHSVKMLTEAEVG